MKGSGTTKVARMVVVYKFGLMVHFTKVIGKMTRLMEGAD